MKPKTKQPEIKITTPPCRKAEAVIELAKAIQEVAKALNTPSTSVTISGGLFENCSNAVTVNSKE